MLQLPDGVDRYKLVTVLFMTYDALSLIYETVSGQKSFPDPAHRVQYIHNYLKHSGYSHYITFIRDMRNRLHHGIHISHNDIVCYYTYLRQLKNILPQSRSSHRLLLECEKKCLRILEKYHEYVSWIDTTSNFIEIYGSTLVGRRVNVLAVTSTCPREGIITYVDNTRIEYINETTQTKEYANNFEFIRISDDE